MTLDEIQKQHDAALMPTYGRFPVALASGHGATAIDVEGRAYIDFGSGIGVNALGYCDEGWVRAVQEQAAALQHISNLYYSPVQVQFAAELCAATGMGRVFLCNSGAEANECAIKAARKWAAEHKGPEYCSIITLRGSFHGRTLGTLAATGQDVFHRDYQPLPGGFLYAQPGECEALERLAAEHPCAAILFEAVQGEGGVRPIGQEFASCLQEVCRKHDLLLMADEVQLGNGRSGSLYGYMNYGLQPDVVSTAKGIGGGLPLGVTMFGERVADVFHPGDHGTTFGGNPVCCAGAVNILSRIDDRLLEGVRERSDYLRRTLQAAPGIRSVTGMGLMLGLEIDIPAREFAERALREGVLVTTAKQKIRLLPALNIPMELLKTAAQALVHCAAE